jgi:hypothetical protein
MPSAPLGKILTDPAPVTENVYPVPAATVLAGGNVIVYAVVPAKKIMFPETELGNVAEPK